LAVKDGDDRDRQQQENFRRFRNDLLDGVDGWRSPGGFLVFDVTSKFRNRLIQINPGW